MAAPNIVNISTITGKTALAGLTTVTANVITNLSGSNTVAKLNNITLTNSTASLVYANVSINRNLVNFFICAGVSVPANSSLTLLAKDTSLYIEEGDVIQANVSANSAVTFTASYEIIS